MRNKHATKKGPGRRRATKVHPAGSKLIRSAMNGSLTLKGSKRDFHGEVGSSIRRERCVVA